VPGRPLATGRVIWHRGEVQVAELHATKGYGGRPGLAVALRPLEG